MTRSVSLFKYNSAPKDYALLNNSLYIFRCRDNFSPSLPILQLLLLGSSENVQRTYTHKKKIEVCRVTATHFLLFYFFFFFYNISNTPPLSTSLCILSSVMCLFFSLSLGLFLGSGGKKKKTGTSSAHNQQSSPLYVINARASG